MDGYVNDTVLVTTLFILKNGLTVWQELRDKKNPALTTVGVGWKGIIMAFLPKSVIHLCNVPFDNTYTNQIYFDKPTDQIDYFSQKAGRHFTEYLTVRKTKDDGSLYSAVKVEANIESLYGYNYMYYSNDTLNGRIYFAFITDLIYINEETTEIVFETDVYQTWLFDVEILPSFVVREHSKTDNVGDNIVPEKFTYQDYEYDEIHNVFEESLTQWGYLVATTEPMAWDEETKKWVKSTATIPRGKVTGVYQGLHFYFFTSPISIAEFQEQLTGGGDSIVSITLIPEYSVRVGNLGFKDENGQYTQDEGMVGYSDYPMESRGGFDRRECYYYKNEESSPIRNNKLYTAPFFKLVVTNHNGEQAEYALEDFKENRVMFCLCGDISINPTVTLIPENYKGLELNTDFSISLKEFPQCSFLSDVYKLWLTKNQYGQGIKTAMGALSITGGIIATATGMGTMAGVGLIAGGVSSIANVINNNYVATVEPNKSNIGAPKNNLLTAMEENKFSFYIQRIKTSYAHVVDDFFTMYGYQTNKVKVPNCSSRPYFNYVQTIDVNLVGGIPTKDMTKLKAVYNKGVTLWKKNAIVGDYTVDNRP